MSGLQDEFSYPKPNLIMSRNGFSVEVRAPSTVLYCEDGKRMEIFAEWLVSSEPKIAMRRKDVFGWETPEGRDHLSESKRAQIVENIRRAFAYKGWLLVVE